MKKIFLRCLVGVPVGIAITTIISIIISLCIGSGDFIQFPSSLLRIAEVN